MPSKYRSILVVEDVTSLAMTYCAYVRDLAEDVSYVCDGASALRSLRTTAPDVVILDVNLPDMSGLDILREIKAATLDTRVIVITADGSLQLAVQAMREGAADFLVKPFSAAKIQSAFRHVEDREELKQAVRKTTKTNLKGGTERFIGTSPVVREVYRMIEAAAKSTATVYITGESGTGKDVCAQALHANSARADKPFVAINCAAIPRDLLESEIFGHAKGAFTGASSDRLGAALNADGGTLFLDEIGEMDLAFQSKILRFLETRTVQRVGEDVTRPCDVRIVCATNRDPHEEVAAGRFREDLYYRLHVLPIEMPALRERGDDIVLLAEHFLTQFAEEEGKVFAGFSAEGKVALKGYRWPGNIRELKNVMQRVVVLNEGGLVSAETLPSELRRAGHGASPAPARAGKPGGAEQMRPLTAEQILPLDGQIEAAIEAAIVACDGSIPRAAEALKVSPSTLYRRSNAKRAEQNA